MKCKVEGCENEVRSRGYCAKHYAKAKRDGEIQTIYKKRDNDIFINVIENYAIMLINDNKVIIDIEDIEKIKEHHWYLNGRDKHRYARSKRNGKIILLHRLIMNVLNEDTKTMQIDHINGNTLDNRKQNLRIVTPHQNALNKNKIDYGNNRHNGVHYLKRNKKWRAYITYNGKWIHLGVYDTEEEAINARIEAEKKYFKEYRRLDDKKEEI